MTCLVPTIEGGLQQTAIWDSFDYGLVEGDVRRLHRKIADYERNVGFDKIDPTRFTPNPNWPAADEIEGEINDTGRRLP